MKLILLLAMIVAVAMFGIGESFSSFSLPTPGFTEIKINTLPALNEEFELTISLSVDNHDSNWEKASDEKSWPVTFSVTLPKSFEVIDNDFSDGGHYGFKLPDDYQTMSVTRDVGFPPQTTVKIKPTEPGLWQIIAEGDIFASKKIFVTLTKDYSHVSDKPNYIIKKETCGEESTFGSSGITVIDLKSQSVEKIIQDDYMKGKFHTDWKLLGNSQSGLVYLHEYYETIIPILDMKSGRIVEHLDMYEQKDIDEMVRVADLEQDKETGLIYMSNHGRPLDSIIVIDDKTNSVVSNVRYKQTHPDHRMGDIAINSNTNNLYGGTNDNKIMIMDLKTGEVIDILDNIPELGHITDIKANSNTNKIFVLTNEDLQSKMYVIDGDTNKTVKTLSFDKQTHEITINEQANEIYLYGAHDATLHVIDGTDYSQTKVQFYDPSYEIEFDFTDRIAYTSNADGSISMVDLDNLDVDIVHNCSMPSGMFLDPSNQKMYLVGDLRSSPVNTLDSMEIHPDTKLWIEDLYYPRNEYLVGEDIELALNSNNESAIFLDSVFIKNTDSNEIAFTFSDLKSVSLEEQAVTINWNQTDSNNRKIPDGNYALIVKGHDNSNTTYKAHKLLSVISKAELEDLQSLHSDMFSFVKTNDGSKDTAAHSDLNKFTPEEPQSDIAISEVITCRKNPVLVTKNYERFACVTYPTFEKLALRGWEIISIKDDVDVLDSLSENMQDLKRDIMYEFPLSSKVIDNGIGRFNVEFSHKPVLNEEFDITMKFEFLDDEVSNKKSNETVPFTLTLGDGIEYIRGDMEEIERKFSLATKKYNTIYEAENPKTIPRTHESTSTLKFLQSGEQYLATYVNSEHFDTFWFFVDDDDSTVHMKEEIDYDYRALSQLIKNLATNDPESIESELKDIFGSNAKRVLEEYYERFEDERPIAPVDISTTKVQLRDVVCADDIFFKFTQEDWKSHGGIRCGSESVLEYYSGISMNVYDRNEAMKILTVNTDSATMSEENIFVDTRNIDSPYNKLGLRSPVNEKDAILSPPYYYPGQHCSNNALYATFKVPEQVNLGEAFDIILTYNWKLPNPNWDMMSERDKKTMQNLRDTYLPLAKVEEMANNSQKTLTEEELDDLDEQMDAVHEQMEEILDEYEMDDSDFNIYGYQITEYYPECGEPILSITFPEEIEILSDGFEITGSQGKHKLVEYLGEKILSFSNEQPQTSTVTLIVNEHTFNLVNSLNIDVAGHRENFVFSVDDDIVTFAHNPDYLERLSFIPQIDKFGNKIPRHEQSDGGGGYSLDSVLNEYYQLHDMSIEEAKQLQFEFMKHKVLSPDHDFTTFYKIFSGKDISNEIDYVKLGPLMEDIAEFIRGHVSKNEEDIEEWLYSETDLHHDWIEEFLKQYPEFKN